MVANPASVTVPGILLTPLCMIWIGIPLPSWAGRYAMAVKLPMKLTTFRNASGRSHATVNAQMPPEEFP